MFDSPPGAHLAADSFFTPAKRTREHHCNAERKREAFMPLSGHDMAPLCRNLFAEQTYSMPSYAPTQARHLR